MKRTDMTPEQVHFSVPGTVKANERHRHGKGRTWTPASTQTARQEIVAAFLRAIPSGWTPWEGPVVLNIVDVHQLPKKGWLGMQCRKKPDLDNSMKLIADALNGVAYRDDAQIEKANLVKRYGDRAERQVYLNFLPVPRKPLNGLVKMPDGRWEVWDEGARLGTIERIGNQRYDARFWDGCRDHGEIRSNGHRTLKQAEAAIRRERYE